MTLLLNKKAGAGIEGEGGKKTIESFYGQGVVKCTDWDDNQFYWLDSYPWPSTTLQKDILGAFHKLAIASKIKLIQNPRIFHLNSMLLHTSYLLRLRLIPSLRP